MERMQEMIEAIQAEIENAVDKKKKQWQQLETREVKTKVQAFLEKQGATIEGHLVLTYLKSSYITNHHKFKIAIYLDEPFVELYPPRDYISMKPLFVDVETDMDVFTKRLKQDFSRMMASEIEELRKYYMELLYIESVMFFKQLFSELKNDIKLPAVFFGAELGEVKLMEEM